MYKQFHSYHGQILHSLKGFSSFQYETLLTNMNHYESVRIKQSFCLLLSGALNGNISNVVYTQVT